MGHNLSFTASMVVAGLLGTIISAIKTFTISDEQQKHSLSFALLSIGKKSMLSLLNHSMKTIKRWHDLMKGVPCVAASVDYTNA